MDRSRCVAEEIRYFNHRLTIELQHQVIANFFDRSRFGFGRDGFSRWKSLHLNRQLAPALNLRLHSIRPLLGQRLLFDLPI